MRTIKELRAVGERIGREGMSVLAQYYIAQYDGSYKGAMRLSGQLSMVAKMATCDGYWDEKTQGGYHSALSFCEWSEEYQDKLIQDFKDKKVNKK